MRIFLGSASLGLFLTSAPVTAASLCNCCTTAVAENCSAVCGPAKPAPGQCIAMVDYAGEAMIADGDNPIYGISLLNLDIGNAMRPELEEVRRLLEDLRRGAEKDRKISARDFRKGKIDEAAVKASSERYEGAIVNYYLACGPTGTAFQRSRKSKTSGHASAG